ncbi:Sulfotransferase family protein [Marinobacter segnicrescens]|uniref:Sulfotransferase family protein n=1 Tax=Marinobacter segnicrescens TaxID=430453 RepID=A0A1I0H0E5_9GAMM|nr:sulfotransferase [Marinobacter segnicrescens]SET76943.1 Sulfotransferase family protein [Marinobacter segnicrescens]
MSLKGQLKRQLMGFVQRLQQSEELRLYANRKAHDYDVIRKAGLYQPSPYGEVETPRREGGGQASPIFITGRFRSGSTLLWNLFRNLPGHKAFYEPFNERRWFDPMRRGEHTDTTHRGVTDYWAEYQNLESLTALYNEDWIRYRLYMSETCFDYRMKRFVDTLVSSSEERAVLQFNRVDFRLPWLRANYPYARIVHVYRNPRDQWCSSLRNEGDYPASAMSGSGFVDHFYLGVWARDLVRQFPFLADYDSHHRYYLFYMVWKLSYCFGVHYSDISVAMESLTENPSTCMADVLVAIGADPAILGEADLTFVKPVTSRWQDYADDAWFSRIEQEGEAVIREFFQGVVR